MATVRVKQPHSLSIPEAIAKMKDFEDMMAKYMAKATWKGETAEIKGPGVSGSIKATTSDVTVELKLGMMAKAAGVDPARLEKSIARRLKEGFEG